MRVGQEMERAACPAGQKVLEMPFDFVSGVGLWSAGMWLSVTCGKNVIHPSYVNSHNKENT